jgi:hypothetical protein
MKLYAFQHRHQKNMRRECQHAQVQVLCMLKTRRVSLSSEGLAMYGTTTAQSQRRRNGGTPSPLPVPFPMVT